MPFTIRPRIRRAFRLALRRRDLIENEIDEELRFHVEMRVAQLMARGLTHQQACIEARRRFGTSWEEAISRLHEAGQIREERLDMRERLDAAWSDFAYAIRTLGRQPGFTLVVVLTFALGIGANATMFGVIDRLLLRPPPHVARAEEVMQVGLDMNRNGEERLSTALYYPLYELLKADTVAFRDVGGMTLRGALTLGRGATAEQVYGSFVTDDYFQSLGTRPTLGRFFLPSEGREWGGGRVAVVSYGFWQNRLGGDRAILGKTLHIGPHDFTVVGVAPNGFTGVEPARVDVWIPIAAAGALLFVSDKWASDWGSTWLRINVRLRPGISPEAAAERVNTMYEAGVSAWRAATQRPSRGDRARFSFHSILPSEQLKANPEARVARLLVGVAAVVLLIACANVANLLLSRGAQRRRELAIRLALGVSRGRLLRFLLAETVVLAAIGGLVALVAVHWGVRILHATLLSDFAWAESGFDGRVLAVTMGLVITTTLLAGLGPAIRSSTPNVTESLKAGGREGSIGGTRARTALMLVQAALSVFLIVAAGLFVHSLRQVATVRLGYETDRVIAATMDLETLGYKRAAQLSTFEAMRDRVATIPGVASAAVSSTHPLHGWGYGMAVRVPGRDSLPRAASWGPYFNTVGADYFATLGLRIVEGRPITAEDVAIAAPVAVLSEPMARAYWPREPAVGRCILLGSDSTCTTVVGVAADAREQVTTNEPRFLIYMPAGTKWGAPNVLLVRSRADDPSRLVAPIRKAMQGVAPDLPYADVQPFEALLAPQIRPWKMGATLFAMFGVLALAIAAVGLYSAISYNVAQRGYEFGVRIALGAGVADVVPLVMGQGVRAAALGIAVGSSAALLAGRFVAGLLFQTSPRNPLVFATVAILVLLVAAAASFVPAWRAARVDPVKALRGE